MLKKIRTNYQHTIYACYIGYITQAIINNFAPLLLLTFQSSYAIPLSNVGLLITINFGTQLLVDFLAAKFADRIGHRQLMIFAHASAVVGLLSMAFLPELLPSPFAGLVIAVVINAIGGGLTEVLISPIVEACPTDGKAAAMSMLHSFYCWGSVGVVLISTLLFKLFGIENWRYVAMLWALIPLFNLFYFSAVPILTLNEEGGGMTIKELFRSKLFWILVLIMIAAGASEQAMSQWASAFAESGLRVSKTVGDLAGPCMFSLMMGISRVVHSKLANRINLYLYLTLSGILCVISYLIACLSPWAVLSLVGCGLTGFSVGAMWPGAFSLAGEECPKGGTSMFALMALAGDLGCSGGPTLIGFASGAFGNDLKTGLLFGILFPILLMTGLLLVKGTVKKKAKK